MSKANKKTYLYLWLLLAVGLAVAVAISLMHDPSFFGLTLKQGTFSDVLLAEETSKEYSNLEGDAENADLLTSDINATAPEQRVAGENATEGRATLSPETGADGSERETAEISAESANSGGNYHQSNGEVKNILIFGDSMTILVANRLAQYGAKNGYKVTSVTWDSSSSVTWSKCDTLDNYIRRSNPDLVMIVLGSNELFLKDYNARKPNVQKILQKIGGRPYLWISPPNWKEDKGYNAFMKGVLAPGTFYNSNPLELPRQKDHIHPTKKGGEMWTDSIMKWVPKSAHPFPAQMPDAGASTKHDSHYFKARR